MSFATLTLLSAELTSCEHALQLKESAQPTAQKRSHKLGSMPNTAHGNIADDAHAQHAQGSVGDGLIAVTVVEEVISCLLFALTCS